MPIKPIHILSLSAQLSRARLSSGRMARWLLALFAGLTLFSCTKEYSYEGGAPAQPGTGDFRATINGVQWIAADSAKQATILGGQINLIGTSSDHKQLSITLDDTVTGVYPVNQLTSSLGSYVDLDSSAIYAFTTNHGADTTQAGGTVTVTSIDKLHMTISGTFAFKVWRDIDSRGKNITNGVFTDIPYVNNLQQAGGGDTMLAVIDGVVWNAQTINATAVAPQIAITGSYLNGTQMVTLIFPLSTPPGTYTLDISTLQYFGIYNPVASTALTSSGGSLTIISNNVATRRIVGKFQFKATDPTGQSAAVSQIQTGYFSVKYG